MNAARREALTRGALSLTATAVIVAVILFTDPEPAPVMLGIALGSSLSRSQLERDRRGRVEALALLPVLGLLSMGIGALLRDAFWVGAAVYVVALVGATLLRGLGEGWRRASTIAATPLLAVLFLPAGAGSDHGPVLAVAEPLLVSVLAWTVVTIVQLSAQRAGLVSAPVSASAAAAEAPPSPGAAPSPAAASIPRRWRSARRAALQLAVGLVAAFVVGDLGFGAHWAWVVLSTVIVAYLPRGRADAVSKGVHRFVGAAVGSLVALVPLAVTPDLAPALVAIALGTVGLGILLREVSYAAWAFGVTVALTLLERLTGQGAPLIGERLVEIAIGVAIGLLAVCVVLPTPTSDVVRARLSPVLAAVSDRLAARGAADAAGAEHRLRSGLRELDRTCAPLREAGRMLSLAHRPPPRAVTWVDDAHQIASAALSAPHPGPAEFRRAVGDARRALRTPLELGEALRRAAIASG